MHNGRKNKWLLVNSARSLILKTFTKSITMTLFTPYFRAMVILLLLGAQVLSAQSEWEQQYPDYPLSRMQSIVMSASGHGYAGGNGGTIYRTDNAGQTWTDLAPPQDFQTYAAFGLDAASMGQRLIAGTTSRAYASTDGGQTWTQIPNDQFSGGPVDFALFDATWYALSNSVLLKTTDSGQTWTNITPTQDGFFSDLDFVDASTGWIANDEAQVFRTTDGGQTWTPVTVGATDEDILLDFVDTDTGFLASGKDAYRSTDGGETWTLTLTNAFTQADGLTALDANRAAVVWGGAIAITTDAGQTWPRFNERPNYIYQARDVAGLPDGRIWFVAAHSLIAYSAEAGVVPFTDQVPGRKSTLNGIVMREDGVGLAAGNDAVLLRTIDRGATWTEAGANLPTEIESVGGLLLSGDRFLVSGRGGIAHSDDGGLTWTLTQADSYRYTTFMQETPDGLILVLMGQNLYASSNQGNTWVLNNVPDLIGNNIPGGFFGPSGTEAWISGREGRLLHSTNGGVSWETVQTPETSRNIGPIHFTDADNGMVFLSSNANYFFRTTDGGTTWTETALPGGLSATKIRFANDSVGFVGNQSVFSGTVLQTTDGGVTWELIDNTRYTTQDFAIVPLGDGLIDIWTVGFGGTIFHIPGLLTSVRDLPVAESLGIYPNPVGDLLYLDLPDDLSGAFAQWELYDAAGRRVGMQTQAALTEPISLPASLAPGMYWLTVRADGRYFRASLVKR